MNRILTATAAATIAGFQTIFCLNAVKGDIQGIQTLQYRANNPIEDRICYSKLKKIRGVLAAVFDGHGGDLVAQYAAGNLTACLDKRIQQNLKKYSSFNLMIEESLKQSFDDVQNGFLSIFKDNIHDKKYQRVGACALATVITRQLVFVANAGDCEGVILGNTDPVKINERLNAGEPSEQKRLKQNFPNQPDIYKCIQNTNYCYVKGRLQPTRSLGDFYLKNADYNFTNLGIFTGPYITHQPKMSRHSLTKDHNKLVLASDGLWDQLNENEMNKIARSLGEGESLCEKLFQLSLEKIKYRNTISWERLEKTENRRNLHDDISIISIDLAKLQQIL